MMRLGIALVCALLLLSALPACDSADPSGPRNRVVTVTASPQAIDIGESALITVTVFDADGNPSAGETVALATTLGTLEETALVLDTMGRGTTTLEAGDVPGTAAVSATITAGGEPSTGSTSVTIGQPADPPGELDVQPSTLDLTHSRIADPCPNPFVPPLMLTNVGVADLDWSLVGALPDWLEADAASGEVPATVELRFSCDVPAGDQDLEHMLPIQGVDRESGDPVGDPVVVTVTLQVRD
jgi:hypothetical protein